jgi:hypothetical protein
MLESFGQADRPAGDRRTRSQQLADALVQAADVALASGRLPTLRTVKPHVIVTIGIDDLVDPSVGPGAARTGFGAEISAARVRILACDGNVTRIVIGPEGQPLDLGRDNRITPPHLRRAVEQRTGTAYSPDATRLASGATSTTWCTGPTTERPVWRTWPCCASGTTPRSTTASLSSATPTADGAPTAPTAPRSSSTRCLSESRPKLLSEPSGLRAPGGS